MNLDNQVNSTMKIYLFPYTMADVFFSHYIMVEKFPPQYVFIVFLRLAQPTRSHPL